MTLFSKAAYAFSVASPGEALPESQGEIAFAGRSNAGKSSAINALTGRQRLAFVSKTPGRTQMINFFSLGSDRFLVDLPGYGYAKAPGPVRDRWGRLLEDYLRVRAELRGMVLVMDIRHPLTELDQRLIEFVRPLGIPVHVLLTKCDKISRVQAAQVLDEVGRRLAEQAGQHSAQLFSSLRRIGLEEAEQRISDILGVEYMRPSTRRQARGRSAAHPHTHTRNTGAKMNPRAKGG